MYGGGSLCFSQDGSVLLSPVGNRLTAFHLTQHRSTTFPFSLPAPVVHVALCPSSPLLLAVDATGRAVFVHWASHQVLFEHSFGAPVTAVAFSPSSPFLAVAVGPSLLIFPLPCLIPSYHPLQLHRRLTLHSAAISCLSWSRDGMYLVTGGEDGVAKVVTMGDVSEGWEVLTLAGHRGGVVGAWFAAAPGEGDPLTADPQPSSPPSTRLYSVSRDGALLQWRWKRAEEEEEKEKAPVRGADDESVSSHVQRPSAKGFGAVRLFGVAGRFVLSSKRFFAANSGGATVSACSLHSTLQGVDLLLVAFTSGSFSLYDLPAFALIHSLSVSSTRLSAVSVSPSGAWLACGSKASGALLVWEWQSESYVLRQQGHSSTIACLAFSPDSQYAATGGDDGRVKVWHAHNGFCFKTFAHHTQPVSAVAFSSSGTVLFSASLDGACHAYDLVRYRLFRTFTSPTPCQFSALAVDPSGELLMAATSDPFELLLFHTQTGRLLEVCSGHEGPISGLSFSPALSLVLSSSWDRSVRLWDPFEGRGCVEVLTHEADVLALAVSPSGLTVACALLNGQVAVWDLRSAALTHQLEVGKDIRGGRGRDDVRTVKGRGVGYVTSLCWSADGQCLLVCGNSRFVCIYEVQRRLLVKRFALSSNEWVEGTKDRLNSRRVNDPTWAEEAEEETGAGAAPLPGVRTGDRSSRRLSRRMRSRAVSFAPSGLQWAAATTEGLLTFALDEELVFDPTDLSQSLTPTAPPPLR